MLANSQPPEPNDEAITLLIVDDDDAFRVTLAQAFERRGYRVRVANSYDQAMRVCEEFAPERVIVDMRMPGPSGLELLRALKQIDPATAVVILTGYGSIPNAVEAVKLGAIQYLTKPAEPAEIEAAFTGTNLRAETGVPSLDRAGWEHIQRVLSECGGSISEAARRLDMHRRTLQRKLRKDPPRR